MKNFRLYRLLLLSLSLLLISTSILRAVEDIDDHHQDSKMLKPVIIKLAIPEKDENSPEVISAMQDKILKYLEPYQIENITRFRYTPALSLSAGKDALKLLNTLDEVEGITEDSLSSPHSRKQNGKKKGNDAPCDR